MEGVAVLLVVVGLVLLVVGLPLAVLVGGWLGFLVAAGL